MEEKKKKAIYEKWWFWVIIVIVVFGCFGSTNINLDSSEQVKFTVNSDYIENSKGKEVFEKICKDINIEVIEPTEMADSWNYENGNLNSSLQINSDKTTDEIYYIKLMATEETNLDDFLKVCELEYNNNDVEKAKNWVKDNIGSTKTTTIGKMYFKLSAPLEKPILEIYTFNGKMYEEKQEKKMVENL